MKASIFYFALCFYTLEPFWIVSAIGKTRKYEICSIRFAKRIYFGLADCSSTPSISGGSVTGNSGGPYFWYTSDSNQRSITARSYTTCPTDTSPASAMTQADYDVLKRVRGKFTTYLSTSSARNALLATSQCY